VRGEDRRFIHCIGSNALYDGTQIADDDLRSARILYLGGYCLMPGLTPERVAALFQRAGAAGVLRLLNVVVPESEELIARHRDAVLTVMPWTDLFVLNNDEAARLTGMTNCRDQAEVFRRAGCHTVVITRGGDGALCVSADGAWEAGVHRVPAVDGTGTGDAFVAGYVYGLLRSAKPDLCLRYGSAMGASCVQSVGATTGALTSQQLEAYVESHALELRRLG
jgi:sugar/nucleoside kinase (ribokinase family)